MRRHAAPDRDLPARPAFLWFCIGFCRRNQHSPISIPFDVSRHPAVHERHATTADVTGLAAAKQIDS
jgi:hypothetical protein